MKPREANKVKRRTQLLLMILIAVVLLSNLRSNGQFRRRIGAWKSRDYKYVVLQSNVNLYALGGTNIVGTLNKGCALFVPHEEDTGVTDPSDLGLHKLFVRFSGNTLQHHDVIATREDIKKYDVGDVVNLTEIRERMVTRPESEPPAPNP